MEKILVVAIAILSPFAANIYSYATKPNLHFIYSTKYEKNPVLKWNRDIENFVKEIEKNKRIDEVPDSIISKIGEEIYSNIPVMLSSVGFKPFDSVRVHIENISDKKLKNIRVFFDGCVGYNSFSTYPDRWGELLDKNTDREILNSVTVKYHGIQSNIGSSVSSSADITYYGFDAANCEPIVQAELKNGELAVGKKQTYFSYYDEVEKERNKNKNRIEFIFKFFVTVLLIYLYFSVRSLKRCKNLS